MTGETTGAAVQLSIGLTSFAAEDPGDWDHMVERARMLDEEGVDRLVVSDHVVFGEAMDAYGRPELGGTGGGRQPTGPDGHWLEPLTTLAVVAGATSRIRLGTNILLAALRRPVVLAKTAATLDVLSGGRLDLGVGVGWQREEYDAAGLDFARRGRLLDQSLEVCRTLWTEERADLTRFGIDASGIHQMPKPRQIGGVPIWVSGRVQPRVVARVARFGAGWIPWGDDAADPVAGIGRMRAALEAIGHDPSGLQVVGSLAVRGHDRAAVDEAMSTVAAYAEAGVTDVRAGVRLPADPDEAREVVRRVVVAFREVSGRQPPG